MTRRRELTRHCPLPYFVYAFDESTDEMVVGYMTHRILRMAYAAQMWGEPAARGGKHETQPEPLPDTTTQVL